MMKDTADGFAMALADSVPGVSGGTVAFVLGFYDQFIGSIHDLFFGGKQEKIRGLRYLLKLGCGWVLGMALAVVVLNGLFESHMTFVSSLFLGFVAGAIPVVILQEKESVRQWKKGILFCVLGAALVVAVTYLTTLGGTGTLDLGQFSATLGLKMFIIGMIAISAMFLPGISGSTMLLVFGAYIPIMTALRSLLKMDFSTMPAIIVFICGILAGAFSVVKLIQKCLETFRPQMIYLILGMLLGSLYAIVMGPTTLKIPQDPLSLQNFSILAFLIGIAIIFAMEAIRYHNMKIACRDVCDPEDGIEKL